MELSTGIYESLIYEALKKKLHALNKSQYAVNTLSIDSAEVPRLLTNYISKILSRLLTDDKLFESLEERISFINKILHFIEDEWSCDTADDLLVVQNYLLSGIISKAGKNEQQIKAYNLLRPKSGFTVSNLFTGSNHDLSLQSEINLDIQSADEIYWIVAFIKFSGVRIFKDALSHFLERPDARMHIITTSYMAASEPKALQFLKELSPEKVDIRVTYDTTLDRLHAKSYIFLRNSGLHTAYIGSSNLTMSAMTGLEWNIRVTSQENPQIIKAALATFDTYWNRPDFEPYDEERFRRAIYAEQHKNDSEHPTVLARYMIRPEQKEILDKLSVAREVHHSFRNLVVAATGTGKTVIAAFDYKRFHDAHPGHHNLLFIVHRKEILEQSIRTFRSVLNDPTFGELWVGEYQPSATGNLNHLFISIQTFNSNRELFTRMRHDFYDYIIVDEAHHSTANSYRILFQQFNPSVLLGLTATPERADGQSLLPDFDNRIAAEIRLPEAINRMLLCPFQYFCIGDDTANLLNVRWTAAGYDERELAAKLNTRNRLNLITATIPKYLADEMNCRALCFCINIEHARTTAEGLREAGYRADTLTGQDSEERRRRVLERFETGKINYLCVVDILNEGVDIPEIDTVLFLRPTKSLTIFLQQLGRGLRLAPDKDCLTVLDFVLQAHHNYSFESRLRPLLCPSDKSIASQIKEGFPMLPRGCAITMDKIAQRYILDNIRSAIFNQRRIVNEMQLFQTNTGRELTLSHFLEQFDLDIRQIYKNNKCWSFYMKLANQVHYEEDKYTNAYERNLSKLLHINSIGYISFIQRLIANNFMYEHAGKEAKWALMFYYALYNAPIGKMGFSTIDEGFRTFAAHPLFVEEVKEIMSWLKEYVDLATRLIGSLPNDVPLELYGCYSREEQLILFGRITAEKNFSAQSGIYKVDEKTELLWVTLNKSDRDFSPSTQYEDYAISETLFQWQSQNSASHDNAGRRYVDQVQTHQQFLLFVREQKKDAYGLTESYYCLGPVRYVSSRGDRPMTITWRMENEIPGKILEKAEKLRVG